jgi:thioester reductase-like protein
VKEVWRRDGEALARVFVPVSNPADMIHPEVLTLDACVQLMIAALPPAQRLGDVYVGLGQAFTRMYQPFPPEVWALVILDEHSGRGNTISANILIFDDNGAMVGEFGSVSFSRATADSLQRMAHAQASTATKSSGFGREQVLAAAPDQRPLVLQTYLISTTAQIMGTTADRLDAGQPILDLVDSLMSVELKNQIETDLGVDLPVADLLNGQSIADLAAGMSAIHFANGGGSPVKVARAQSGGLNVQQMQALAVLPEDIRPSRAYTPKAPKAVFLTGATGFVGAYLLAELLNQTDADVICLVRGLDEDDALDRLQRNLERYELWKPRHAARIVPLLGDLAEPNFGLTDEQFSALALTADLIWHNGALVKWTYPYMALAKANVDGTREILRLACMGGATPVQFVSTVGVFSSADFAGDAVYENEPIQNAGVLHVGYAQSKWVGEALVREAGARGLPVTLYRINTGGDSRTGTYNPNDYLPLLLKGCVELGSAPYDLDLTVQAAPIDYVGRAMVALSLMPASIGETFHMVNMGGRTWSEMVAFMQSEGYPVQTVRYGEWQAAIEARSKVEPTFALAGLSPLFSDMFAAETRLPIYADTRAAALLAPLGITCPPLNADLLRLYFTGLFRAANTVTRNEG